MIEPLEPLQAAEAELRYMKQTVAALREELERSRQDAENAVQHT